MATRKKRVPVSDTDLAAEIRPGFAVAADAARKAISAGKFGRWTVAPETYVEVWYRGSVLRVDAVVDNFLLGSVKRGCKIPRLDEADDTVLRNWVGEGPELLVAEARRTVSVLVTGGARHTSVVIMAASCRRLAKSR